MEEERKKVETAQADLEAVRWGRERGAKMPGHRCPGCYSHNHASCFVKFTIGRTVAVLRHCLC